MFNPITTEQLKGAFELIVSSGILDIPPDPLVNGYLVRHDPDDPLIGYRDWLTGEAVFISGTTYREPALPGNGAGGGERGDVSDELRLMRGEIIARFIGEFSDILELTERYSHFETWNAKMTGGCFERDGVEGRICYNNTMLSGGYHAAKGTPFGFYAGLTFNTLGIYNPDLSLGFFHRMDHQGHFCFKGSIAQHHKLKLKEKRYSAYALYEYMSRKRPGNIDGSIQQFQRHCVLYSSTLGKSFGPGLLSRTSVAAGASYITGDQQSAGPVVAVRFFSLYGAFALIDKEVDYLISWNLSLPFRMTKRPWRFIQLGIDHERFRGEKRFLFSVGIMRW